MNSNSADGVMILSWRKRRGKKGRESNEDGVEIKEETDEQKDASRASLQHVI